MMINELLGKWNYQLKNQLSIVLLLCISLGFVLIPISSFADSNTSTIPTPSATAASSPSKQDSNEKSKSGDKSVGKKSQSLGYFNTVNLSGIGNLYIKQTDKPDFTVEAENSILPLVIVYVKDKTLYIDLKNANEHAEAKINYYLNVKDLKSINSSSSSTIYIKDTFKTKELDLAINSFGEAIIDISVNKFVAKLEGGGKLTARGYSDEQNITISGAGEYHGEKLKGKNIILNISGSGLATTGPSDTLNIKSSGESTIKYCGKPTITKEVTGKGVITAADNC